MKLKLLAVTMLGVAALSTSALAADPVADSSYGLVADIWGGAFFVGGSSGDADDDLDSFAPAIGGEASMLFGFGSDFMLQLSGESSHIFLGGNADDDQYASGGQGAIHLMHSSGFGIFGGGGVVAFEDDDAANLYFIGGEYNHEFGFGDFLLQAGYLDSDVPNSDTETLHDAWFVRVAPNFNLSSNMSLGLTGGYANGDADDENTDVYSWGASFNYHMDSMPVTWFLAYDGIALDNADASTDEHQVKLGLSMALGGMASQKIDTPDIYRWVAIGQRAD